MTVAEDVKFFDESNHVGVCILEVTIENPNFKHWSSIM